MSQPNSKRGRPRLSDRVAGPDMRDLILLEAGKLFRMRGTDNTSMAAIAEAAGVTAPALYWHFSSKEELVYEFLRLGWDDFAAEIEAGLEGAHTPREKLFAIAYSHTMWQLKNALSEVDAAFVQMLYSVKPEWRDEIRSSQREYLEMVTSVVEGGIATGDFEVEHTSIALRAIVNVCEYAAQWYRRDGELSMEEISRLHAKYVLRMVGDTAALP